MEPNTQNSIPITSDQLDLWLDGVLALCQRGQLVDGILHLGQALRFDHPAVMAYSKNRWANSGFLQNALALWERLIDTGHFSNSFPSELELRNFLTNQFANQQESLIEDLTVNQCWQQRLLLHVGCGDKTQQDTGPGFLSPAQWREIRVDVDPGANPDIRGSLTNLAAIPSHSVDAVFSSHTLEHLYWQEVPKALGEIYRVLKPSGFTLSWVPDLQVAAQWILQDKMFEVIGRTPFGPLTPFDLVFSHRGAVDRHNPAMAHHCGFTLTTLGQVHQTAGFGAVYCKPRIAGFDLQGLATKAIVPPPLLQTLAAVYFY